MTKIINLTNFPIETTTFFGIINKEKGKEFQNLSVYVDGWKKRFPEASNIKKAMFGGFGYNSWLKYYNAYNLKDDNINAIRPLALKQINELLADKEGDQPITKLLKEVGRSQKGAFETDFNALGEVASMIFIHDSIESVYLKTLPEYIQDNLNEPEAIKFEELDKEKLKNVLTNENGSIFSAFYSVNKVEVEDDLKELQTNITIGTDTLKKLIEDIRIAKKSKEPEKPKEDIEAIKKELKAYQDAFSTFYSNFSGQEKADNISVWFKAFKKEWDDNFAKKYGAFWDESLKKVKVDLDQGGSKPADYDQIKADLKKWTDTFSEKDYPKGAEDVGEELKELYAYFDRVLDRLAQRDNYIPVDEPDKITNEPEQIKT